MSKELPNIFKGNSPKNLNQRETILKNNSNDNIINNYEEIIEEKSVKKQIKDVFSSENFVYKADTVITLTSGEVIEKTIIGKTNDSLITMDDELIEVSSISKIEVV